METLTLDVVEWKEWKLGTGNQIIRGFIPLSEMFGYATDLRSKTQGRGTYSMEPSHYEGSSKVCIRANSCF